LYGAATVKACKFALSYFSSTPLKSIIPPLFQGISLNIVYCN